MPRSAYIHVPFCRHRCGYCNFTLVAGRDDLIGAYLEALERELSWLGSPQEVDTLFFGGGTPSHLSPEQLRRLFETVGRWLPRSANCEVSIEANPADVTPERVAVLQEFGVGRVSLGAQSFKREKLRLLERDHSAATVHAAVDLLRPLGSVSLDLIFAAPNETLDDWMDDLQAALHLRPDHVSTYGLTYERGTRYYGHLRRGDLHETDEETQRSMYLAAIERLTAAGLEHYEVSNFARAGHRCRHNEVYWTGGEFFAAGPGAARYVAGRRETNHRSTTAWLRRVQSGLSPVAESETLSPEDRAREQFVFAMRRLEGVDRSDFHNRTGFDLDDLFGSQIARHAELGLLRDDGDRVRLTRDGLLVSDALWGEYLLSVE